MFPELRKGQRVCVKALITDLSCNCEPDPGAEPGEHGFIHALPREMGTVQDIDSDGDPTIKFDRAGTCALVPRSIVDYVH